MSFARKTLEPRFPGTTRISSSFPRTRESSVVCAKDAGSPLPRGRPSIDRSRLGSPSEKPSRSTRPAAHAGGRDPVGIFVRSDQGRLARGPAVRAGGAALFLRRRAAGVFRPATADALGRRRGLRRGHRRGAIRAPFSRHQARDAGRTVVAGHPASGLLHRRLGRGIPRRQAAEAQPDRGRHCRVRHRPARRIQAGERPRIDLHRIRAGDRRGVRLGRGQRHRQARRRRARAGHVRPDRLVEPDPAVAARRAVVRVRRRAGGVARGGVGRGADLGRASSSSRGARPCSASRHGRVCCIATRRR